MQSHLTEVILTIMISTLERRYLPQSSLSYLSIIFVGWIEARAELGAYNNGNL